MTFSIRTESRKFPRVMENVAEHPVLVRDRKHLRQLCEENGLRSDYLDNHVIKRPGSSVKRVFRWDPDQQEVVEVTNGSS